MAPKSTVKVVPVRPTPLSRPATNTLLSDDGASAMRPMPAADSTSPTDTTVRAPCRSASHPANGPLAPLAKFFSAMPSEKP